MNEEIKEKVADASSYSKLNPVEKKIVVSLVCCLFSLAIAGLLFGFAPGFLRNIPALIFTIVLVVSGAFFVFLIKANKKSKIIKLFNF